MWKVSVNTKALKRTYEYRRAEIAKQQYDSWVIVYGAPNVNMEYVGLCDRCKKRYGEP